MPQSVSDSERQRLSEAEAGRRQYQRSRYGDWVEAILGHARGEVLDLGAGDGAFTAPLAAAGAPVTAADLSLARLSALRAITPRLAQCDALQLPFRQAGFDTILFVEVLEHLPDRGAQRRALSEFVRTLRPGGRLILTTPNRPVYRLVVSLWAWFGGQPRDPTHFSELSLGELTALVSEQFEIVELRGKFGFIALRPLQRFFARRPRWCYDVMVAATPRGTGGPGAADSPAVQPDNRTERH